MEENKEIKDPSLKNVNPTIKVIELIDLDDDEPEVVPNIEEKIEEPEVVPNIQENNIIVMEVTVQVANVLHEMHLPMIMDLIHHFNDNHHPDFVQDAEGRVVNHAVEEEEVVVAQEPQNQSTYEGTEIHQELLPNYEEMELVYEEITNYEEEEVIMEIEFEEIPNYEEEEKEPELHLMEKSNDSTQNQRKPKSKNLDYHEDKIKYIGKAAATSGVVEKILKPLTVQEDDDGPKIINVPQLIDNFSTVTVKEPLLGESSNAASTVDSYTDDSIECLCCYNEVPIEYMVQCYEAHLFCCQCLERCAQEAVYGQGKGQLKCVTFGCEAEIPRSQLSRALPDKLFLKYEERVRDENLNIADLENFIKCKYGDYGAVLDPESKYFPCPQCKNEFCRLCQVVIKDHKGLTRDQIEKDGETKIRKDYEEKMTKAKIRTCSNCKSHFTKERGCNKITCRCGMSMCYICRKANIDYKHYCLHLRLPEEKGCSECEDCFLWSNADEDDKLAIEEIKKDSVQARQNEGFNTEREIGVPTEELIEEKKATRAPVARRLNFQVPWAQPQPQVVDLEPQVVDLEPPLLQPELPFGQYQVQVVDLEPPIFQPEVPFGQAYAELAQAQVPMREINLRNRTISVKAKKH